MIDFKEIATAWYNKITHTKELKKLADSRFDICLECPSKQEFFKRKEWSLKCGECGCPLKGKVYTTKTYLDKNILSTRAYQTKLGYMTSCSFNALHPHRI